MRPPLPVRALAGLAALALAACTPEPDEGPPAAGDPIRYVDPFIGSGGFGFAFGSAFPGALAPNGLVKAGPDTSGPYATLLFLHYSGYWHGDDTVLAFTHLHLHGTGAADYGVVGLMPTAAFDPAKTKAEQYASKFAKENESASPGYYATTLDRDGVRVEITATEHAAHHRWTFPGDGAGTALVDLTRHLSGGRIESAEIAVDAATQRLRGRVRSVGGMTGGWGGYDVWFEVRAARTWTRARTWADGAPTEAAQAAGKDVGAALEFGPGGPVELQIGLSLVSAEGAKANLAAEMPAFEFDATKARTEQAWRERLEKVRIYGGTEAERRMLYSALYRIFVMPSVHSDVDGSYRGFDQQIHKAEGFRYVSDLSLWDTYRTVHPLYALVAPDVARDAVRSLHAMARDGGFYPMWPLAGGDSGCMIGASADIVLADAHARGITGVDWADAYERARAAALDETAPAGGRGGRNDSQEYLALGYVPATRGRSVSRTLEYAHDDFALAQLARGLGRGEDADALLARSRGWKQLYDPATGFLRGRLADGSLAPGDFDPLVWNEFYAEANAWQSLWPAHDPEGLAELMGGREGLVERLERFFDLSVEYEDGLDKTVLVSEATTKPRRYYWHGNEPDLHAPMLLAQAGRRDLAQRRVRWVRDTFYSDRPDGLAGNDDGGTLSAWYVLTALGLYPVAGTDRWIVVPAPVFPKTELVVPGGVFTVEARQPVATHVLLDGAWLLVAQAELAHEKVRAGGRLEFVSPID